MKLLWTIAILALSISAFASKDVVYGQDDRKDVYQTTNALHLNLAKSSAGMINKSMFVRGALANTFDLQKSTTLERALNVCTSENFSQQSLAPICSGFLVGPDTLITAGHCYKSFDTPQNVCKKFAWVFDYEMKTATSNPTKGISIANIYNCKSIVKAQYDNLFDFAIIKLDRHVVGRTPLKYRTSGKIANSASLVVIGHPTGLPTKIAANGKVTLNNKLNQFSTTLDTFHGNSGSAVFDATTGQVEGILIMGKNDYRPSILRNQKSCQVANICDETASNCSAGVETGAIAKGEVVLRIDKILTHLSSALVAK